MTLRDIVFFLRAAMAERAEAAKDYRLEVAIKGSQQEKARSRYREAMEHVESLLSSHQNILTDVAQAVAESDMDVSPCRFCNKPILCIPDGLPCCDACEKKEATR